MSDPGQEVRRLLERLYLAIDADDFEAIARSFCAEAAWERPDLAEALRGRDRILEFYRHERQIARGRHRIEHLVVDGDRAAAWGDFAGSRTSGVAVTLRFADCFTLADGRIRTRRTYVF